MVKDKLEHVYKNAFSYTCLVKRVYENMILYTYSKNMHAKLQFRAHVKLTYTENNGFLYKLNGK